MLNVEFSDTGWALSENPYFTEYILKRMRHATSEEWDRGYIEIRVKDGKFIVPIRPEEIPSKKEKRITIKIFNLLTIRL